MIVTKICRRCCAQFNITEQEQKFFTGKKWDLPNNCFACRAKKRDEHKLYLQNAVGGFVRRTQPLASNGTKRFMYPECIKIIEVTQAGGVILYKMMLPKTGRDDVVRRLSSEYNDGYWKVVEYV